MLCAAATADAADLVLGLGRDNLDASRHQEATAFLLEYHTDAIRTYGWGTIAVMGVVEIDDEDDAYVGAGLSALWSLSPNWFAEGSLAAGYYGPGRDGRDLGGNLQFRSLIGLGYRLSARSRVSISFDHLSNAGLEDHNPGRDAVFLRYARSF